MRMLLHICCAPCSVAIVEKFLAEQKVEIEGLYLIPTSILKKSLTKKGFGSSHVGGLWSARYYK